MSDVIPPLLILDRDGVINFDSDAFIKSADEWQPIPGSLAAIARFKRAGWQVAVATNQSGIARGYYDRLALRSMHLKLDQLLASEFDVRLDWLCYAPYVSDQPNVARKPLTGMLRQISLTLNRPLQEQIMVGDTLVDVQAAQAAGMRPFLVRTGKGERTLAGQPGLVKQVAVYDDLAAVADALLVTQREQIG
jgi:D-glycero-D-manno-heptose 1,7-bisphosphate phosphatase